MKGLKQKCLGVLVALTGLLGGQQALAQSCTMVYAVEATDYTSRLESSEMEVPQEGAFSVEGTLAPYDPAKAHLMFAKDRDCPVDGLTVTLNAGGTDYPTDWGAFDGSGMQCSASSFNWPTGATDWAGCYASNGASLPTDLSGGATITIERTQASADEAAACKSQEETKFDAAFGGADATCLTNTYEVPAGANWWAGFANDNSANLTPLEFPYGGEITFDCTTVSGTPGVKIVMEDAGGAEGANKYTSQTVTCPAASEGRARSSMSVTVPASDVEYTKLLLYLDLPVTDPFDPATAVTTAGGSVVISSVAAVVSSAPVAPPVTPVPALPFWALLGLAGLVGLFGFRRR